MAKHRTKAEARGLTASTKRAAKRPPPEIVSDRKKKTRNRARRGEVALGTTGSSAPRLAVYQQRPARQQRGARGTRLLGREGDRRSRARSNARGTVGHPVFALWEGGGGRTGRRVYCCHRRHDKKGPRLLHARAPGLSASPQDLDPRGAPVRRRPTRQARSLDLKCPARARAENTNGPPGFPLTALIAADGCKHRAD